MFKKTFITLMISMFAFKSLTAQGQTRQNGIEQPLPVTTAAVEEKSTYTEILDILMPMQFQLSQDVETALIIRVQPSFEPEFQYIFIKKASGEVEITKKQAATNVDSRILDVHQSTDDWSANSIAKQIAIKEKRIRLARTKFDNLVNRLNISLQKNKTTPKRFGLDGTRYVFWFNQVNHQQQSATIWGSSLQNPPRASDNPLIRWFREMQKEVGL